MRYVEGVCGIFVAFSNVMILYLILGQEQTPLPFHIRHWVNIWKLFIFNHLGKFLFTTKTGNGIILWFLPKTIFLFFFILTCMERVSFLIIRLHWQVLKLVFKRNEELYKELICFSKLWFFFWRSNKSLISLRIKVTYTSYFNRLFLFHLLILLSRLVIGCKVWNLGGKSFY